VAQNVSHWVEYGYGMYVLDDRRTGAMAGRAGLKYTVSDEQGAIELAYAFQPDCWGQGYAGEISAALIALGFKLLPVDVLSAVAIRSNTASRRVMEKTGLRYVGESAAGGSAAGGSAAGGSAADEDSVKVRYEIRRAEWRQLQGQAGDELLAQQR
jgi:RimJ/RimL family protein N-acetyltransferase